jgi:hypothetical protein
MAAKGYDEAKPEHPTRNDAIKTEYQTGRDKAANAGQHADTFEPTMVGQGAQRLRHIAMGVATYQ